MSMAVLNSVNLLALNFSPLKVQYFEFNVYRRIRENQITKNDIGGDIFSYSLPKAVNSDTYIPYWVSFEKIENFEEFKCNSSTNNVLTLNYLFYILKQNANNNLAREEFLIQNKFGNKVSFIINRYEEGMNVIWVKPYFLKSKGLFGFLIDSKFLLNEGQKFNKKVQVLSKSLDKNYRSNVNFYADKYLNIKIFAEMFYTNIFKNQIIDFTQQKELEVTYLTEKIYRFENNKESYTRQDIRKFKPYESLKKKPTIFFYYKKEETSIISRFYQTLADILKETFSLEVNFKSILQENYNILNLSNLIKKDYPDTPILVLVLDKDKNPDKYYPRKFEFINSNIPIQNILYDTTNNNFSVLNMALQIFCKLGGKPWCVKPTNEKCLIIGMAEAHQINKRQSDDNSIKYEITKYYSYSVLLDSSGIYKSLRVLGDNTDKKEYLYNLGKSIESIVDEYKNEYEKIVIHTPFKVKDDELKKIKEVIQSKSNDGIEFVVIRINEENDFFGYYKASNTLTPQENTAVKISKNEYLIWFEGLPQRSPNAIPKKRYSAPTYVDFTYQYPEINDDSKKSYLQDIINLAGANWRGFNAKSTPISIYYCRLVAKFISEFRERGFQIIELPNHKPWFL